LRTAPIKGMFQVGSLGVSPDIVATVLLIDSGQTAIQFPS
jgi:hypothetical protein